VPVLLEAALPAQIAARPRVQEAAQVAQQPLGAAHAAAHAAAQAAEQRAWLAGLEGATPAVAKAMAILWNWKTVHAACSAQHVASTARPLQLVSRADAATAVQAAARAAATLQATAQQIPGR
jgi:hypothetical protein